MTMDIGVAGCSGRMGLALLALMKEEKGCRAAIGSIAPNDTDARNVLAGAGFADFRVTSDISELFSRCDAVIDFTAPEATRAHARTAATMRKILIIGTTGLNAAQQQAVREAALGAPIVQAANFSLGVNVLEALVEKAAALLSAEYDIEIDEMHHARKKDAPSGTALALGRAAARGRGVDFEKNHVHYGEGVIGERKAGTIGMSARRGGEVVGVHTVTLAGPGENLELTHRAASRQIYARGALRAALWAKGKPAGLYSMRDVLGI